MPAELPSDFPRVRAGAAPFTHRMRVRYNECDQQGVVFNANFLTYFDIAMTELWREAFGGYEQMLERGWDMVVAEARVRYLAPLRFDEEFEISARVAKMGTTSLTTEIWVEKPDGAVAEGEIRHVFVAAGTTEKAEIPAEVREKLETYSAPSDA